MCVFLFDIQSELNQRRATSKDHKESLSKSKFILLQSLINTYGFILKVLSAMLKMVSYKNLSFKDKVREIKQNIRILIFFKLNGCALNMAILLFFLYREVRQRW